ncbi:hypothetical protein EB001_22340 [bacterium]|jgi:hypothetical protein|nr:hypothetical protein [bacterium]
MTKKDNKHKHSPARLYEFVPDENIITPNNIVELANIVRVGIPGHVLEKLSPELQQHFKEVA